MNHGSANSQKPHIGWHALRFKNAFYLNQFIFLTVFRCTSNCRLDFKANVPHPLFTPPSEVAISKERQLGYFSQIKRKERFLADFSG